LEDSDQSEDVVVSKGKWSTGKEEGNGNARDSPFEPKSPRKKPAPKKEPVYIIPDVARKETTFRGRLGKFFVAAC